MQLAATFTVALAVLCATGCATSVSRATPEEMRAAPGASATVASRIPYERAYTKTLDQVKACFERGGTVRTSVFGDKSEREAHVTLALASIFNYRIMATIEIKPSATGTDVTLYSANDNWNTRLHRGLTDWLVAGTQNCPDDASPSETITSTGVR